MRILRAFVMAAWGHRGQRDKAGRRYLWHLMTVAWIAYGLTRDPEAVVVGLLHDYVEDVNTLHGFDRLRSRFGMDTAMRVMDMTQRKREEYMVYIARVSCRPDRIVHAVKIADLLHNLDGRRGAEGYPERAARYQSALGKLAEAWSTPP